MPPGSVRIIAGKWRGRKLKVPPVPGVRPTPDRVRETLFNWLALVLPGARCLDLFAGSGVLGFEALSRGAKAVVMVDQSPVVVQQLQEACQQLGATEVAIHCAKVPEQLPSFSQPFDIVFLDPPYQAHDLLSTCAFLETHGFLADTAYLYLEAPRLIEDNELPTHWRLIKRKQAGQVAYHLAYRQA